MAKEAYDAVMPTKADANETNEANKANKDDELTSWRGLADDVDDAAVTKANDAEETKATDADEADEANLPNKAADAVEVNKANLPNKAIDASEADEVEATEANKADAIVLFFIIANIVILIPRLLLDKGMVIILYSLTKYSAVFAKRKGYFGIMISNNQRGCFLEIWNDYRRDKIDATINLDVWWSLDSLRTNYPN
jgi:hypothetical protein